MQQTSHSFWFNLFTGLFFVAAGFIFYKSYELKELLYNSQDDGENFDLTKTEQNLDVMKNFLFKRPPLLKKIPQENKEIAQEELSIPTEPASAKTPKRKERVPLPNVNQSDVPEETQLPPSPPIPESVPQVKEITQPTETKKSVNIYQSIDLIPRDPKVTVTIGPIYFSVPQLIACKIKCSLTVQDKEGQRVKLIFFKEIFSDKLLQRKNGAVLKGSLSKDGSSFFLSQVL